MSKLSDGDKANFDMLKRACENGDLALVDCQLIETGKSVAVVCAVNKPDGTSDSYGIIPIAMMFDGDPYELLNPPSVETSGYDNSNGVHRG